MTAKDCLYNIPDETRFVNIFFRANGIKWREIFGRQRYSENVRQVPAPAVELQRPTRPLIRLLNRNKPFPTELFIIGSRQCKQSVGRDALIPPWRNLYRLWQALQMICRIRCSHRAVAAHQTIPANSARLLRADDKHLPLQTKSRAIPHNSKCRYGSEVPQPPERCLSRKAGIVRCCLYFIYSNRQRCGIMCGTRAKIQKKKALANAKAFW